MSERVIGSNTSLCGRVELVKHEDGYSLRRYAPVNGEPQKAWPMVQSFILDKGDAATVAFGLVVEMGNAFVDSESEEGEFE